MVGARQVTMVDGALSLSFYFAGQRKKPRGGGHSLHAHGGHNSGER